MSSIDKAAEVMRLADGLEIYPSLSGDFLHAANLLREYAALLQAQTAEAGRAPLTDEAIHEEFHRRMSTDAEDMAMDVTDFRLGARFAERHHGILPKEN